MLERYATFFLIRSTIRYKANLLTSHASWIVCEIYLDTQQTSVIFIRILNILILNHRNSDQVLQRELWCVSSGREQVRQAGRLRVRRVWWAIYLFLVVCFKESTICNWENAMKKDHYSYIMKYYHFSRHRRGCLRNQHATGRSRLHSGWTERTALVEQGTGQTG